MRSLLRPRGRAGRLSLLAALAASGAIVAAPAAASADSLTEGALPLIDKTEPVGPGITMRHIKALNQSGWYSEELLTVNLAEKGVSTNLLTSGPVASGGPLSEAADKAGAVAGINGGFFDIGNSNAAEGGEVQGGELVKSPDINQAAGTNSFGVSKTGLAELANLAVETTATFGGSSYKVASLNASDGAGVPNNDMVAYTSAWGSYSRARGFTSSKNYAEVLVEEGKVASIDATGARAGQLPAGAFALVGSGTAAEALKTLAVGDEVTLQYALANEAARNLQFALGDGGQIVKEGKAVSGLETSIAPRTSIGFKDGGHTLVLATWDGPGGTGKGGIGVNVEAADMAADGVETAVNLDGGGSTTMVARALGDEGVSVVNEPSEGYERSDPNGVGVFVAPGNGQVEELIVKPGANDAALDGSARVFPGMHRTLQVHAVDNEETPVALGPGDVSWSASEGSVENGLVAAPADAPKGTIDVQASDGPVKTDTNVRVLGPVRDVELSTERLSIAEPIAEDAVQVAVTARDEEGYTAPLEPEDLNLEYDHSVIEVTPDEGRLKITPLKAAGTILTVSAGGKSVKLPITIGVETVTPYAFNDEVTTRWHNNSTAATTFSKTAEGLKIEFAAMRNVGISAANAESRVTIPGQPLRLRMKMKSSISVPSGLSYISYYDGTGKNVGVYGTGIEAKPNEWQYVTFTLPANTVFPISVQSFQGINTNVSLQKAGYFILGAIEADVPTSIELPEEPPLQEEKLISDDGKLPTGGKDWTFGTISDIQFTAENPDLAEVATTAIHRIRETNPDFIIFNGDVTDRGLPQDLSLAREVLENAGCEIVAVGNEPASDYTPSAGAEKIPCYYVPGNHESYGLNNVQETLANWEAQFGRPYRAFDHKGTEFILLASSLGTLRGTNWEQMPFFQKTLEEAATNPEIHNVMVFDHHPVDDPSATKASQLGDREEVKLIEQMLTNFRESSGGKGVAMVSSHAQVAYVHHIEGVPYVVLPSSGKDPYGTPDRGGFTGWDDWSIDPEDDAEQPWLTGDIHAFAQSITLNTPETIEAGKEAQLSGSIVQPEGVSPGTRIVPLRYPMSVDWGGSDNLAIGSGEAAIEAARAAGKVAILDPRTRMLTALKVGTVKVSVTNDSMRPYTGSESLAPIVAEKTIRVIYKEGEGPSFSANTPVFTLQPAQTTSEGQVVTVHNTGVAPLIIGGVSIRADDKASRGDFLIAADECSGLTLAAGEECEVVVRFAPGRIDATSNAALVFPTNDAKGEEDVPLTGISTTLPQGPEGPEGAEGKPGPVGPEGPAGTPGAPGAEGPAGAPGPEGPAGVAGAEGPRGLEGLPGPVGPAGAEGPAGPSGPAGPTGATGATGPRGPQGVPGRDAIVRCTVSDGNGNSQGNGNGHPGFALVASSNNGKGGSSGNQGGSQGDKGGSQNPQVTCTVTYVNASHTAGVQSKRISHSRATLTRHGRTYARGTVSRLRAVRTLKRGSYTLRVKTGARRTSSFRVKLA